MSPPALFVAGAGTEIGKTYVTAALTRRLRASGPVLALKPLASGVPPVGDPAFAQSDTARLLAAQGLPVDAGTVEACSPWRFAAPLAPDQAAAREGRRVSLDEIVAWCRGRIATAGCPVVIEGVGGLMSPITDAATGLDWIEALALPVVLVSGSYLGAISHALTAAEVLRLRGLTTGAVVVSESEGAPTPPETVAGAIARHTSCPVFCMNRGAAAPEGLAALVG
ncbi:dethiobiotin synthase [Methylobacterium sp. J-076]|uniref:dethiobiotin synthase n=1 Tax=Methylobacterium sp. J-076 TaxID=2836655 RepID=UPI001FBAD522|nr:dethiobiotin synthase [Methylobacterium sp. J-076]MCJ2013738.1 dethiobiotin synthase [Methylobacterium sp. J-076]